MRCRYQTYGRMRAVYIYTALCRRRFSPHTRNFRCYRPCGWLSEALQSLGLNERSQQSVQATSQATNASQTLSRCFLTLGRSGWHRTSGLSTPHVTERAGSMGGFAAEGDLTSFLLRTLDPTLWCRRGIWWEQFSESGLNV